MTRIRRRPVALLSALFTCSSLAFESNFSFYPPKSQSCLDEAAKAAYCKGDSAREINVCLCGNGGDFIINSAKCVGQKNKADVSSVYNIMSQACSDSGTPMTVSQSEFFKAANGEDTTTAARTTSTSMKGATKTSATPVVVTSGGVTVTVTPTQTVVGGDDKKGGLSSGATIGIAVGASVAGVAALSGLILCLLHRRKKKAQEEAHPMLSQQDYHHPSPPTTYPPTEPSPGFVAYGGAEAKTAAAWSTSSPDCSPVYKSPVQHTGPYVSPPAEAVAELPPQGVMYSQQSFATFEMDGTGRQPVTAAEMPTTEPQFPGR
ncbi:hypothetical protein DCS_02209 [Drechmeria coniospora]|uniref:Extracellular membrane protein CFEM domain-containing protein n=1 Tax=Drechmeria coniospora TaxID=98403 RepID=A0A151GVF2_DRECN|nr:hypothetical protein DCS_02209 [Drechmeria coniospora]KYK61068.1 hypothetical protein DCS_02209 [Drechmeria coniospora]